MPYARDPFVQGVVDLVVLALQFPVPLPTEEGPRGVDPDVPFGVSVAERHAAAVHAESFVDQHGGARPASMVERRLVQRGHDALERLPFVHDRTFASGRSVGPNPIGSGDRNPPLFRICSAATSHTDAAGAHCPRR